MTAAEMHFYLDKLFHLYLKDYSIEEDIVKECTVSNKAKPSTLGICTLYYLEPGVKQCL